LQDEEPSAVQNRHFTRGKLAGIVRIGIGVGLVAGLGGCASAPYHGDEGRPWPPAQMRPVSIAIAPPIDAASVDHLFGGRSPYGGESRANEAMVRCIWQEGAALLAEQAIPGTAISTHLFGRWALGPSDRWLDCTGDAGGWRCTLTDEQAVDFARRHEISHLVVPHRFRVTTPDRADSTVLLLSADVAVVDPLERKVIWNGAVTGSREDLRAFDGLTPALTPLERAAYTWLVALFRVFDRIEVWPEEDLGVLVRCCQDPPPLFDWPEENPADLSRLTP
jgi:hypothetical protein